MKTELKIADMLKEALEIMSADMLEGTEVNIEVFDIIRDAWNNLKVLSTKAV